MTDQEYSQHWKDLVYHLKCLGVFGRKCAEDIAQECMIILFNRLKDTQAEPIRDMQAWLRFVARNLLHDEFRRAQRVVPLSENPDKSGDQWVANWFITYIDPEREYIAKSEVERLKEYIDPREFEPDKPRSKAFSKRLERFRLRQQKTTEEKANGPQPDRK